MPDDAVINKPIYLAFQAFGPGHYDGVVQAADKNITGMVTVSRHEFEPFISFKPTACVQRVSSHLYNSAIKYSSKQN